MTSFLNRIVALQKFTIAFCSLMIAVTFGFVVVLRYGFQANLFAYEEWILVAAFVLYFIGGAQGSYTNTHIKADLVKAWVASPVARKRLGLLALGLEVIVCAVLSYWGLLMVADDLARYPQLPSTPVYNIPLAVPRGTIFIGFVLMTIYAAMHFYRLWRENPDLETEELGDQS